MKVKEVVLAAATELGFGKEVESYFNGYSMDSSKADLLLHCFNVVENEMALDYLPLYAEDEMESVTGKIYFTSLFRRAVRIVRVTDEWENSLPFTVFPDCIKTQSGRVRILYTYTPESKDIYGESDYSLYVSVRLFAYGMAAEYASITGGYEEAEIWDKKYKEALDAAYRLHPSERIKSRRWV